MLSSTPRIVRSLSTRRNSGAALTPLRFRSASAPSEDNHPKGFHPVYVQHVSKITLEYMQEKRSDWLMEKGLDRGLHINPDGTFSMSFPAEKGFDFGRIWTSYNFSRKQHWLSVYRQRFAMRFLLKDSAGVIEAIKVHESTRTENKIFAAVDQLISSINQTESFKRASR